MLKGTIFGFFVPYPAKKIIIISEKIKEAGELVDIHSETLENKKDIDPIFTL